jgi:ubiquinone/menaquinone biosynthesis C-methylase UbiE
MVELSYPAKTIYQSKKAAQSYDQIRFKSPKGRLLDKREKKTIGELLSHLPKGSLVLDLACGTGRITEFLLSRGYKVWGADISPEMLEVARIRLTQFGDLVNFYLADAENLPFKDKLFDSATCIRLLGHIPSQTRIKILKEIRRVTKGPFVVAYYLSEPIANLKRKIRKFVTKNKAPWFPISKKCLKEEVAKAGLEIIKEKPLLRYVSETRIVLLDELFRNNL